LIPLSETAQLKALSYFILLSFLIKGNIPKVKKNSQTLGLRDILVRRENSGHVAVPKFTGAVKHICYDLKTLKWVKKKNLVQGLHKKTR